MGPGEDDLFTELYPRLRELAAAQMGQGRSTLQPTAIVHEAWVRLQAPGKRAYRDRSHFLALAAVAIRHILIDHVRSKARIKRGGEAKTLPLKEDAPGLHLDPARLIDLEDALQELSNLDQRKGKVVELRVFGGATIEEVAECLGVSHMTVSADWRLAKAWLANRLGD